MSKVKGAGGKADKQASDEGDNNVEDENPAEMTTAEMIRQKLGNDSLTVTTSVSAQLKELYKANVRPVEAAYRYDQYCDKPIPDGEFDAKPIILVLGQAATGKSTFIRHFLGQEYPGMKEGAETTTEHFSVLLSGKTDEIVPGHSAATDESLPFQALGVFGNTFLNYFRVCKTNADLLHDLWFVDTPGILSGVKQRARGYNYIEVIKFFAKKATRVVLLFDHSKLDINTEFGMVMNVLREFKKKIRVVLNKATDLSESELVRVYGSLMWNLCVAFRTPEEIKIYVSSFPEESVEMPKNNNCSDMFRSDAKELRKELEKLPHEYAIEKMNAVRRRTIKVKLHARVMVALKDRLPKFFGKKSVQLELIDHMKENLEEIAKELNIPVDKIKYMQKQPNKDHLMIDNLSRYKSNTKRIFEKMDAMVNIGIPKLLNELSGGAQGVEVDRELVKLGLKKRNKDLIPRTKNLSKSDKKGRPRGNSDGGSVASSKSMFSVSSMKSKVMGGAGKVFSKIRRGSKASVKSRQSAASPLYPGSIADDAMSVVSNNKTKPSKVEKEQNHKSAKSVSSNGVSGRRQTFKSNPDQRTFVEKTVAKKKEGVAPREEYEMEEEDDHLDLFSVISEETTKKNDGTDMKKQMRGNMEKDRTSKLPPGGKNGGLNSPSPTLVSPRSEVMSNSSGGDDWVVPMKIRKKAKDMYIELGLRSGIKMDGLTAMKAFQRFGLPDDVMRHIWQLVDFTDENAIDEDQFAVAIFLLKRAKGGAALPKEIPYDMIPPSHRDN